ncbi:hypothetical protein [Desulfobacter vibrioformis]|uniref:hypothetical protein n=1 Tax=Desulfobacter vibrioformis TaxID=34031 RepID=UPI0005514AC3|nr:hypothetical protein [Desulfobacter vibrioformis]
MRILSKSGHNKLTIVDKLAGGEEHDIYYRMPTTQERQEFEQDKVKRDGDSVQIDATGAAYEAGKKILTGIRDGDFGREDETGEVVQLSSTPGNDGYLENWKDLVCDLAPDHVILLGLHVFENPTAVKRAPAVPPKQVTAPGTSS